MNQKIGTEIFVTIATLVAVLGGETVAGAVLMVIILIAESIAELNTERARASIKELIGSVPQIALVRSGNGEGIPKDKIPGSLVFAGTVMDSGALDIQTDKVGVDTTFSRIIALVEDAQAHQAPVQKLADQVAAWLIPVVFVFLIVVYWVTRDVRTIVTLMIFTSPAELGLATPLVMIAAIARAARHGILIKGGLYLESLAKVDTMVFDKTGTLSRCRGW
jgi:cation transport ATPase